MRKPLDESGHFQKRYAEKGPYYVIYDQKGQLLATSRVFRNEAWYAVGCALLKDVPDAEQRDEEEPVAQGDKRLRGFAGILIKPADEGGYQFEYITVSGRTLLTSAIFFSRLKAEREAEQLRIIVRDIMNNDKFPTYTPSK